MINVLSAIAVVIALFALAAAYVVTKLVLEAACDLVKSLLKQEAEGAIAEHLERSVDRAVELLPPEHSEQYRIEWIGELAAVSAKRPLKGLLIARGLPRAARRISRAAEQPAVRESPASASSLRAVAKAISKARHHRLHELARFGLVGGFNASTYFGGYTVGVLLGVPYLLSALVAFFLSASLGYWLHEHWTFKGASPTVRGWVSWLAAQGGATLLNLLLLAVLVDGFSVGKILAQAVLLPVIPIVTYAVGRRWVLSA